MIFRQNLPSPTLMVITALAVAVGVIIGLASIWVPPVWTVAALVGVILVVLAIRRPEYFVLGYLVLTSSVIYETKVQSVSIGVGTVYLTDLILILSLGLIIIRSLVEVDFRIVQTPLDGPLLLFLGGAVLCTVLATMSGAITFNQSLGEVRTVGSYLLFFAVTNLVRDKRQIFVLVEGILLLATVVAVTTIAQYVLGNTQTILAGRIETYSSDTQVYRIIPLGQSVLIVSFIAIFATLVMEKSRSVNVPRFIQCGLIGLAIIITFFRASWVAIGVSVLYLGFLVGRQERQRFTLWLLTAFLATVLVLIVVLGQPDSRVASLVTSATNRLNSLTDPATYTDPSSSLRWRDFEYSYAIPHILSNPIIGIGLGALYRPFIPPKDWSGYDGRAFIHNGFVWIWMKTGIFGFLGFLGFLFAILTRGITYWRRIPDIRLRAVLLAFSLGALGVIIVSNVEPYVMEAWWTPVIGVIAGVNEVIIKQFPQERSLE